MSPVVWARLHSEQQQQQRQHFESSSHSEPFRHLQSARWQRQLELGAIWPRDGVDGTAQFGTLVHSAYSYRGRQACGATHVLVGTAAQPVYVDGTTGAVQAVVGCQDE